MLGAVQSSASEKAFEEEHEKGREEVVEVVLDPGEEKQRKGRSKCSLDAVPIALVHEHLLSFLDLADCLWGPHSRHDE
jgi:hypothetical protein